MSDDDDRICTWRFVTRDKIAANQRRLSNRAEQVGGNRGAMNLLGHHHVVADAHRRVRVGGELLERLAVAPVLQLCVRRVQPSPRAVMPRDHVQPIGLLEGQAAQERAVDDAEANRIRPDAECQDDNRCSREPAILRHQSNGEAQVLDDRFDERQPSHVPMLFSE
jgi:hypothetical protein